MALDLPQHLRVVLEPSTEVAWMALVGNLPPGAYLVGGTGIAAHLGHRVSRDFDFFVGEQFDPQLDASDQHPVDQLVEIGGMPVAGLGDLLATKLKVIGDRGELRDYFDLLVLERAGYRVEEGLATFVERYRPATPEAAVLHIVRGLGYLADVADDPALPMSRQEIENYWTGRQPTVVRSLEWLTGRQRLRRPPGPELSG